MTGSASWNVLRRLRADPRVAWGAIFALLGLYLAAFLAFYPSSYTNTDESMYVRQARVFVQGELEIAKIDPLSGERVAVSVSKYPVGTALFLTPFVWAGGWKAAFLAPCLALFLAVLFTARWLQDEGRSPLFALLVFGFVPVLVLGRVPISDVPSLAIVSLGLWLFWRGLDRGWPYWLASGFAAGASIIFREPNALIFAPFFAGTVLRREWKCWALVLGGLLGVALRPLTAWVAYGDPFFVKAGYYFTPGTFMERVPFYAFGLLVLMPGGLLAAFLYRGRRRPELVVCVVLFVAFFLTQKWTSAFSGLARALVTSLRYLFPVLPVLAFALAEVVPRLWRRTVELRAPERRLACENLATASVAAWIVGLAFTSTAVHFVLDRWTDSQAEIRDTISRTIGDDSVIVTNWHGTRKFLKQLDRPYVDLDWRDLDADDMEQLVDRHGEFFIAILDRSDSEFWRNDALENQRFVDELQLPHTLEVDERVTATDHLRIWRVGPGAPEVVPTAGRSP
jgi:hypothetical protein